MIAELICWSACLAPRQSDMIPCGNGNYFWFELPSDRECDDLDNKYKWKHLYKGAPA